MAEDIKHVHGSIGDEFGAVLRETIAENKRLRELEADLAALRQRHMEAVERAVDELFVNGQGEQAHRLVLTGMDGRDLGGWCKQAVINTIERALTARKDGSDE